MRAGYDGRVFSKHRLEALSDGIFAIAMTLLVLDLKVPEGTLLKHFALQLTQEWIGVVITFAIAAIYWTIQHHIFALIPDVHERAIVPTFVFLGLISVLPFSTGFFSQHVMWRSAFVVYFTHAFLIGAALLVKLHVLLHYNPQADPLAVAKLRLRLGTLCSVMSLLAVISMLLPLKYISGVMIGAAAFVQVFTRKKRAALERKYSREQPALH